MKAIEELNNILEQAALSKAFPGGTYAIIIKDKTFLGVFGKKAWFPVEEENSLDTIYDLASLSKVIATTSCIMKLVEMGKIRLFSKVSSYLPEFKHDLTLWNLLTHTSGLQECINKPTEITNANKVWEEIYSYDLKYEPLSRIIYSDINFILLGKIIEIVSGKPLDVFADEYIFKPLEMNNTGYNPSNIMRCAPTEARNDIVVQGIVRGRVHDETAYILGGVSGHAGVFSTAEDLSHFASMILNKGVYKGKRIFSEATINMLYEVQVEEIDAIMKKNERRAIGWIVKGQNSSAGDLTPYDDTILHTGFTGTNIWIDRKDKVAFVMLTNRVHPTRKNSLHIDVRPRVANFIMANLERLEKEI